MVAGAGIWFTPQIANALEQSVMLHGHVPEAIARLNLQPTGRLPGTNRLHLVLGLPLRNPAALSNFLAQVYDPASPNYRRYLTREQFTEKFGPTAQAYQAAIDFAQKHGLEVSATHGNRILLDIQGRASDIEAAFHVNLHTYQHPTESRTFYAPDVEPTVDPGVPVREVIGLNDYARLHSSGQVRAAAGTGVTASGSGADGFYLSKDFRNAYLPGSSLAGSGQVVGLFEADGYYANDITSYESKAGLTNVPLQNILIDGFNGTPVSDELEVALDIEMAIAMAPALAKVVVFESPGTIADWVDILDSMAASTQINQFSSSWGYTGGSNPNGTYDSIFMEMAAQGQSFFQAAGDGDAWVNTIWVPGDSPYVTVVGGTSLTMSGSGKAYTSETVWNLGDYTTNGVGLTGGWSPNGNGYWGSGGGICSLYSIPSWQAGINMTTNHGSTSQRNIPDVAMVAYNIAVEYNNGSYGESIGTSASAPLWAGFTALINQEAAASHKFPIGFLNPTIYAFAQQTNYTTLFHDITTGNNTSASSPSSFYAVPGYDLCTGLGTPNGTNLIYALMTTLTAETAPGITNPPASQTVAVGGTASFSLTATGTAPLSYFWRCNAALIPGATNATYTTNNAQLTDSGKQFSCLITNAEGSVTSQVATLTVLLPPGLTASPTNQTIVTGGTAGFSVTATGAAPLSYFWMCNTVFIPGATNANYATNNVQLTDSGTQFSCLVSNAVGTITSQAATLTVLSPPSVTGPPVNQTVATGGTASFSITTAGSTPLSYFWRCNTAFIPGATNATYATNNVQLTDSGKQFSCLVSNAVGVATSQAATLTVLSPPSITTPPTNLTVAVGGTASFSVTATGAAPLSYFWLCNAAIIPGATNATYATNNVQLTDSGKQFSCLVSNAVGTVTSPAATLIVLSPPSITTSPTNLTVAVGGTVGFSVTATGAAPLGYFWLCNSNLIAGATNATYATNNVQLTDSGKQFSCLVSNAVGTVTSQAATLTVLSPPSITASPTNLTVAVGGTANFSATATGSTPLGYFWLCNSNFIAGATNAAYAASNLQLPNSGAQFSCLVSNAVGTATSAAATLTILAPPSIITPPTNVTVAIGGSASFAVNAVGAAPLYYCWMCNSNLIAGATNAAYAASNLQLPNSGAQFSCVVSNAVGMAISAGATLTVTIGQAQAPIFNISLAGANLIINGSNGVAGGIYAVLVSSNLMLPINQWTPVATNVLGANGPFTLTATNAVNPAAPQQFYLLQVQ